MYQGAEAPIKTQKDSTATPTRVLRSGRRVAIATPKAPETAARKGPARVPTELPKAELSASKTAQASLAPGLSAFNYAVPSL